MKFHLLEGYLQRCISTVTVEMTLLEDNERTRHNESREHLEDELKILRELAERLEQWRVEQATEAVRRMELMEKANDKTKD